MKPFKKLLLWIWLVLPFALLAYHYGPGKFSRGLEQVEESVALALSASELGQWEEAAEFYQNAIQTVSGMPVDVWSHSQLEVIRRSLILAEAASFMKIGMLPEAIATLEVLLSESSSQDTEEQLSEEIRSTLAKGKYYASWLMRLEGTGIEAWEEENESARLHYKWLVEKSAARGDVDAAQRYRKNLEAVILLARMELSELQEWTLPKEYTSYRNFSQRLLKQREIHGRKSKEG